MPGSLALIPDSDFYIAVKVSKKIIAVKNLENEKWVRPGLVHPKNQKLFKISCHIESCGTCIEH
jgi:hypothetical protein